MMHTPSTWEAEAGGVPSQLRLHSKTVHLEKFLESYLVVTVRLLF